MPMETDAQQKTGESFSDKLDWLLTSRRYGMPLMGLTLAVILWLTVWGANYPGQWLEQLFGWGYDGLRVLFRRLPQWLSGILLDGVYAT